MTEQFIFSIPRHLEFLAGYMDAVGRSLTTDEELYSIFPIDLDQHPESMVELTPRLRSREPVANWSKEFGDLVESFLQIDQRQRLGFYLIDYICWLRDFTESARCFRLHCELERPRVTDELVYLLELEGRERLLLFAQRIDKAHNKPLQPIPSSGAGPGNRDN